MKMRFSFLYELGISLLALVNLPKIGYQMLIHKKYLSSFKSRLWPSILKKEKGDFLIWIHAVSLGETKAIAPIAKLLKNRYPHAKFIISSVTETGHVEAIKAIPFANQQIYLPFDFSWITKPLLNKAKPDLVLLSESDFWYNFLRYAKKNGALLAIANGKLSEKSTNRFQKVTKLSQSLFSLFDLVCVQSFQHEDRFRRVGVSSNKLLVTGNIKFDAEYPLLSKDETAHLLMQLGIAPHDIVLTIGSTHHPEEEQFLPILQCLWKKFPHLKVLLTPRHPERFKEIVQFLRKRSVAFLSFTELTNGKKPENKQLIVMDVMGQLKNCYQISDLAIVAGSYATHVGGHNILEPCGYGVPSIFGPYMFGQMELLQLVLENQAGLQIPLENLESTLEELIQNPNKRQEIGQAGKRLMEQNRGASQRTVSAIQRILP